MNNKNQSYDKDSIVFQLAKRSKLNGIGGKFAWHAASKENKKMLNSLFNFLQESLQIFIDSRKLSPIFEQLATNSLLKLENGIFETTNVLKYLEEWLDKTECDSKITDRYFSKTYTYDIYMHELDVDKIRNVLDKIDVL